MLRFSCSFLLAVLVFVSAPAQEVEPEENWKLERGSKEWALELGYAPMQPTFFSGRKEYDTGGRKLALGSFRWGRVIGTAKGVTYEYLFEAMPIAIAIKNEVLNPSYEPDYDKPKKSSYTLRQNTYGAAINPAGFRFVFLPTHRLKPFVQMSAGFIFTRKPIPIPQSPSYNFSGDFGAGLMYSLDKYRTVNFGYRYFHISNMNIGEINPGYNANVFYIGYSSFYK
ncbi:MAG TPA: acyloxyacyl hydrolase [Pyrinomonadaceae bacterium]|nr:acyloxyacyl hydrolase [Pyrinomonadaceae bacterium]